MTGVLIPGLVQAQRLVVKIGSALVVDQDQAAPRAAWLSGVAKDIAALRARGVDVIVVSSGAIALARRTLRLTRKKLRLEEKQAAAAVGARPILVLTGKGAKTQKEGGLPPGTDIYPDLAAIAAELCA